ncbi:FAD:protein FMN transferase [Psychrobium sp. 1_MG-2023]|uniref:FAD:protein FMN transferase n=1 Tax=Psychrobium sp. 1_MG-2023 TaxID=3062624 RepID=UPI000C3311FF|nr:FAD:protein FMN transferase [Psychrobium sp. 1_MG-2023]MDP2560021.1 FAD:protein FMN transferase [Psychrobium sp. 1_MG-2023]PKF56317.1 FAD:protein FMN transferase ApbE [Alteromonadales bacterium alter-6D02]
MFIKYVKWLALLALAIFLSGCSESNQQIQVKFQGRTMGVDYHITYIDDAQNSENVAKARKVVIDQLLETVNAQMSTYRQDSELSKFNQSRSGEPFVVSPDTALVVSESIRLANITDGKLDVTVGPLVNLWGFGPDMRPEKLPSPQELADAQAKVGIEYLSVNGNALIKTNPELYVDLSTTAKGFGVDKIADYLDGENVANYLVEIGGEVRAKGQPNPVRDWVIAIEKPVSNERAIQQLISPRNNGLATSGDYRQYFEEDGQRFSHIIDPDTGMPINHKLVSVTVIHPSCMTADGLSTSVMLMGPEAGLAFAKAHNIAVFMIIKTDNGFEEVYTDAFKPFLVTQS